MTGKGSFELLQHMYALYSRESFKILRLCVFKSPKQYCDDTSSIALNVLVDDQHNE